MNTHFFGGLGSAREITLTALTIKYLCTVAIPAALLLNCTQSEALASAPQKQACAVSIGLIFLALSQLISFSVEV
jgi:formate hydrogenlyase subunit 4